MRRWCPIAASWLGLTLVAACSDEGVEPPTEPPVQQDISYAEEIQPIFDARCTVCHQPTGQASFLSLLAESSYEELVQTASVVYSGAVRVVPAEPDSSVLYNKVADTGEYGGIMPPSPSAPLSSADVELIRLWIEQGAQDN